MTDNTVYEVIDRVDTPAGGPTSSFYEKTAAIEASGSSTPDDTAYTVVDRVDTTAGSPTSSFYEKGQVYEDLVLSTGVLEQTEAARDAALVAQAASEVAAASIVPTVNAAVLVETNARIAADNALSSAYIAADAVVTSAFAAADALKANIASPTFTGVPAAPTAAALTNTTQLATTAFATQADSALQSTLNSAIALKAPLASPALTGTPTAPTASPGTNTTQIATTAFTQAAVAALVASSPAALDTLNELAAALGNDANFATTTATALGLKAPLASPAFTGNPTAPTQSAGNNSTRLATTAYVDTADALKANIASPTFTGVPSAPTATLGTNTTQIATTAFVLANGGGGGVTSIAGNTGAFTLGAGLANTVNALRVSLSSVSGALGSDVVLNNTANYMAGPFVAQGSTGTWLVAATVTCVDSTAAAAFDAKLWDGTTILASTRVTSAAAGFGATLTLLGIITSPAGNLRMDVKGASSTNGLIKFNMTGTSKDSTIVAVRIA